MIYYKQNDTGPVLTAQLKDAGGIAVNLDMCGVRFFAKITRGTKEISKIASITDAATGKVQVTWETGDLDTPGYYNCEFQVTFTDDTVITYPNNGYFQIIVVDEIN